MLNQGMQAFFQVFELTELVCVSFHDSHLLYLAGKHGLVQLARVLLEECHLVWNEKNKEKKTRDQASKKTK